MYNMTHRISQSNSLVKTEYWVDYYLENIRRTCETELKERLTALLKPHLRNKTVEFSDSMGQTTVTIGNLVIFDCGVITRNYHYSRLSWIQDILELIADYMSVYPKPLGLEFTVEI